MTSETAIHIQKVERRLISLSAEVFEAENAWRQSLLNDGAESELRLNLEKLKAAVDTDEARLEALRARMQDESADQVDRDQRDAVRQANAILADLDAKLRAIKAAGDAYIAYIALIAELPSTDAIYALAKASGRHLSSIQMNSYYASADAVGHAAERAKQRSSHPGSVISTVKMSQGSAYLVMPR